jgi:outer membrane immunogenic protein
MRTALLAASAFALAFAATPALAQDDPDSDASFTGPRAEAVVGWDKVDTNVPNGDSKDGVLFGGAVGYDFQTGGAVIGFEGEATGASTRESGSSVLVPGDAYRVKAGRDLYVGGRVGFLAGDNALIYAKGGYSNARVKTRYTSGATTIEDHDDLDGWRAGAGAEVKLGGNMYAKAEYRFSKYGDIAGSNVDVKRHQVVGGVGIRF